MIKIYIAGKVTGLPIDEVTAKFKAAQNEIEAKGFIAVNPIELVNDWKATWYQAMRICIKELMNCDDVYLLPDYSNSPGAQIELSLADSLKIPDFESMWCLTQYFRNR